MHKLRVKGQFFLPHLARFRLPGPLNACLPTVLGFVVWAPLFAVAEESAPAGVDELTDVLAQSKYQPRLRPKSWIENLWESHGTAIWAKIQEGLRWLHDRLPDVEEPEWMTAVGRALSDLARMIAGVLQNSHWLLPAILCGFFAYLCWKYRHLIGRIAISGTRIPSASKEVDERPDIDVSALFASGEYAKVIEGIRAILRYGYAQKYSTRKSVSDRELLRRITRDEPDYDLLREVVSAFESFAFADRPIDSEVTRKVFDRFESRAGKA